jgi:hypothetical protein
VVFTRDRPFPQLINGVVADMYDNDIIIEFLDGTQLEPEVQCAVLEFVKYAGVGYEEKERYY